ncbi:hypothetical protein, partial [Salmonella enterica]|uniref:hypothetical protein n=1 Tax=Salmonella enterica TaxID=28901 RepID=UPI001C38137F
TFAYCRQNNVKHPILKLPCLRFIAAENDAVQVRFIDESQLLFATACRDYIFCNPFHAHLEATRLIGLNESLMK